MCTGLETALLVGAGAAAGSQILKPPKVPAPPPFPKRDDPAVLEAREKQRQSELRRRGRASTILTGGSGIEGDAPLSRPALLGA